MKDLIRALRIFLYYEAEQGPRTCCEHDILYVCMDPRAVTPGHRLTLSELGFEQNGDDGFKSYRHGSC